MKVYNTFYLNKEKLKSFLLEHRIIDEKNILIQAFCGITDKAHIRSLLRDLKSLLPQAKIIGSSTDGEICNAEVSTHKTVLSFSILEKTKVVTTHASAKDSQELAKNLLKKIKQTEDLKLLITFTDGLDTNGEDFLKTIEKTNNNLIVAGGLAGDNARFLRTLIFNENGIYEDGAVGAFFYNKDLQVNTEYNFGWQQIGKKLKITKADKNIVYEIDNKPAKEIYKKYLGDDLINKGIEFPLIITKENTKVARAILEVKDNGALVFAGNINEGSYVTFSYGDIDEILHKDISKYSNINNKPSEAYFIYSCMARRRLFGENIDTEILPLAYTAPTCGFFTYGELYHDKRAKKNELLNQTMTILSISENPQDIKKINQIQNVLQKDDSKLTTINTLLNLISTTSKELQELNSTLEEKVEKKTKELKYRFYHNQLTGLKNTNALVEDIKDKKILALAIIEIDSFSNFNEIYGLNATDDIILQFSKKLSSLLKNNTEYTLYHMESHRFAITLTKKLDNFKKYINKIKYIQRKIKSHNIKILAQQEKVKVDTTMGITTNYSHPVQTALIALSHAKHNNKSYSMFSIEMDYSSISKDILYWKREIENAIETNNIIPVFQPIVDQNQNIKKYEILMRLRQYENGKEKLVSPFFFLDTAIKTKLYHELTEIMILKSFKVIAKHKEQFSLNLSFEDINSKIMMKFLKNNIKKYNIGHKLILEVVESENVKDYKVVTNFIKEFKELGVEIAIDDFGSGFSNYMHIMEIEPDYLKIDGSLIKDIDKSKKSYEFVKSITSLSKALGIKTIAEFIHSKEVFDVCLSLGVDQYQGFYFSPPIKEEELENLKLEYV